MVLTLYVPIYKSRCQVDIPFMLGSEYLTYERAYEVGSRSKEFIKVIEVTVTEAEYLGKVLGNKKGAYSPLFI